MRTHRSFVVLAILVIVSLAACRNQEAKREGREYFVYYLNGEEDQLVKESASVDGLEGRELLDALLAGMERDPKNVMYKRAKKDFLIIREYVLEEGKLTLRFEPSYSQLSGIQEVLCRAAIVKTLCQVDEVEYVEFLVGDEPLKTSLERTIGLMSEKDFVDEMTGESVYRQNINLSIYFANRKGDGLVEVPISILFDGSIPLEQLVVQQLIQGPEGIKGMEEINVKPTLPRGSKLNQVSVKERVAYVDFNAEFTLASPDVANEVVLYSVVNALVELPTVDKVQFLINGNLVPKYGEMDFDVPFERNLDIVKRKAE